MHGEQSISDLTDYKVESSTDPMEYKKRILQKAYKFAHYCRSYTDKAESVRKDVARVADDVLHAIDNYINLPIDTADNQYMAELLRDNGRYVIATLMPKPGDNKADPNLPIIALQTPTVLPGHDALKIAA